MLRDIVCREFNLQYLGGLKYLTRLHFGKVAVKYTVYANPSHIRGYVQRVLYRLILRYDYTNYIYMREMIVAGCEKCWISPRFRILNQGRQEKIRANSRVMF